MTYRNLLIYYDFGINKPREWSMLTVVITITVNLTSVGLGFVFVTNLCLLIHSFIKLIRFLTENAHVSRLLQILVVLLCLLLLNDFLAIVIVIWGAPAKDMTNISWDFDYDNDTYMNSNDNCLFSLDDQKQLHFDFYDFSEKFIDISLSISLHSRFIWTFVLFGGMIYLQHQEISDQPHQNQYIEDEAQEIMEIIYNNDQLD